MFHRLFRLTAHSYDVPSNGTFVASNVRMQENTPIRRRSWFSILRSWTWVLNRAYPPISREYIMVIGHYFPDIRDHTCILEYDCCTIQTSSDELSCVYPPLCYIVLKVMGWTTVRYTSSKDAGWSYVQDHHFHLNKWISYRRIPKWGWPSLVRR